ncbi:MAG: SO_0444 family Cu/Zn efflux transporter [Caldisericia bacterium]|nr:SO_0444 family Cu/Zn efflux transporter [Caldisericia bacterium]
MVIGLFLVGILHTFLPESWIAKQVGKKGFFSTFKAALFGVPLPLCSCGVLPFIIYLKKSKASVGALISFLISTPQTGVDSMIATYGLMGPVFAIFRPIAALLSGIIGGGTIELISEKYGINLPDEQNVSECCSCSHSHNHSGKTTKSYKKYYTSLSKYLSKIIKFGFNDMIKDIAVSFLVGVIAAALITTIIPQNYFSNTVLGNSLIAMIVMICIGLPMYICSTSSIPIAVSFLVAGITPGAAFVFLFVGPATNAASISILVKALGKKILSLYLITLTVLAILMGFTLDLLTKYFNWNFSTMLNKTMHIAHTPLHLIVGILFFIVLVWNILQKKNS